MEEHSVFIIYKKENYKYHIVNRKYSASQTISKSYIERSNNMHTHKKTFRIGASKWQGWQDTKGIIRSRKLKKDRKYNDQQNTIHKTIDGATRSPLKTGVNTDARKGSVVPAALVGSSASYKMTHIVRSILTKFVYTKHLGKEGRVLKHVFCLSDQANSSWWPLVVGITEHVIYVADARTC